MKPMNFRTVELCGPQNQNRISPLAANIYGIYNEFG